MKHVISNAGELKPEYAELELFNPLELGEVATCDMKEAGGESCSREKNNEIRVYSILGLCIAMDFYEMISKRADLMEMLPFGQPIGTWHVEKARESYFERKGLTIPERTSPDYVVFSEKNPENYLFDLLWNRGDLLRTYILSDKRPTTKREFEKRMKQVVMKRYYLMILCCDLHQESILETAVKGEWVRREGSKYGDDQATYQRVFPSSLLVAPQRKTHDRVILTEKVDSIIYDRTVAVRELFKSIIQ